MVKPLRAQWTHGGWSQALAPSQIRLPLPSSPCPGCYLSPGLPGAASQGTYKYVKEFLRIHDIRIRMCTCVQGVDVHMFCARISYLYECYFFLAQEGPCLQACLLPVAEPHVF